MSLYLTQGEKTAQGDANLLQYQTEFLKAELLARASV